MQPEMLEGVQPMALEGPQPPAAGQAWPWGAHSPITANKGLPATGQSLNLELGLQVDKGQPWSEDPLSLS